MRLVYVILSVAGWIWLVAVFAFMAGRVRAMRAAGRRGFEVVPKHEKQS